MILLLILIVLAGLSLSLTCLALEGHSQKYIAEAYFDKHYRLIDSEFNDFVRNEIPLGLFKVLEDRNLTMPELSLLQRDLIGEGSHRVLSSSIGFKVQQELKSDFSQHDCEVIVIERLPSGVFADPFELQHLVQRGVFDDAAVFGDTNLELPSFRSNRSLVEVHVNVASEAFSKFNDDLEVSIRVPLHARYPALGVGYSRVEFELPDIFICCSCNENSYNQRSCLFVHPNHINDNGFNNTISSPIVWEIPCGNKEHAQVVSVVTFSFATVAALLIIVASISNSDDSKGSEKPKHS